MANQRKSRVRRDSLCQASVRCIIATREMIKHNQTYIQSSKQWKQSLEASLEHPKNRRLPKLKQTLTLREIKLCLRLK